MDRGDARNFRHRLRDCIDVFAGDKRVNFAELGGRGDGRQAGVLHVLSVVLDQDQNAHFATPSAFSLPTSSSTVPILIPACRLAGSTTLRVSSRRATSTP